MGLSVTSGNSEAIQVSFFNKKKMVGGRYMAGFRDVN